MLTVSAAPDSAKNSIAIQMLVASPKPAIASP